MENSEAVWSDEQLSGARELMAPGPFASEEQTAALDEAVAVLERADRLDERATAALATLAGPAYVPIAPPYFVNWDWGRNYAIAVQLGGSLVLTASVWNPATKAWEQATNGLGGTPVSATREVMTTTDSGPSSGTKSDHVSTYSGHTDSGGFSVHVLVEGGRTYAFGVHVNSWYRSSFLPGTPSTPPPDPPPDMVTCYTSMAADIPRIWL